MAPIRPVPLRANWDRDSLPVLASKTRENLVDVTDDDTAGLTIVIEASSISEDGGTTQGTVTRNTDTTNDLVVTLTSSDESEATVPASVVIPAGHSTSAAFPITGVPDSLFDPTQSVTITASEAHHASGTDTVDITNVDLSTPSWITDGNTKTVNPLQPIRWNPVPGATRYQVWYTNVSTGVSPFLIATTHQAEFVPTEELPIGRFNIWVRAQQGSLNSAWSVGIRLRVWPWTTLQTPEFHQTELRPSVTWDALKGADSYRVVYSNITTGISKVLDSTVTATSSTPPEDLSFGYYRVWVAGLDLSGTQSQWSYPVNFSIGPQPVSPATPVMTQRPVFEWTPVRGAATYELYIATQGSGC